MNFPFGFDELKGGRNPFSFLTKGITKYLSLAMAVLFAMSASVLIFSTPADAIDAIKVKYGAANVSVSIPELADFANTGTQSNQIRSLFLTANATPKQVEDIRKVLGYKLEVSSDLVDSLLDTRYGKLAVNEFSRYFAPGSQVDKIANEVVAAIKQLSADGQISILELVQSYRWTNEIVIDAQGILNLYEQAVSFAKEGLAFLKAQPEVQKLLCS